MSSKYKFNTKFKNIAKQISDIYGNFSVEYDKHSSKDDEVKAYNTLYSNKHLTNVCNYVLYFLKLEDKELLEFVKEQVSKRIEVLK
jgi:hypothetical protein